MLRAVISCEMKRIDEKQFYGAGAGDEIVNSAVMTIATAAKPVFSVFVGENEHNRVESVCCSLQTH